MSKIKGDLKVSRNSFTRSQSISKTETVVSASTLTLNAFSSGIQLFSGTTTGQIVNLGDATAYPELSHTFIFINDSNTTISIQNNSNTEINQLLPNDRVLIILTDQNTADGVWKFSFYTLQSFAAPPFSMGRKGNTSSNTWLEDQGISTNVVGIPIFLDNGKIARVAVDNEDSTTYSVGIYEHDKVTYDLLYTITVSGSTDQVDDDLDVTLTKGKQLAGRLLTGSAKNIKLIISLRGNA